MTIIRLATPADAKGILDIYAPYIENTSFTFETETPSLQAFAQRIQDYLQIRPWLVCEVNGTIAGYAYASAYRERVAYQWCVESSVYVHDNFLKAGVGTALYTALFEILKKQGFYTVYAVINLPNERSVAFHEKMGFEYFASYKNVGYKLGKWKTVGWWQLVLHEYKDDPVPPVKFSEMNKDFLEELFRNVKVKHLSSTFTF
jgi:L-amino acid N-acyltransferase YncA